MKSVGIKELKNKLSQYLDLVRKGELVFVTDRNEVIAEIHSPSAAYFQSPSRWEAFLNEQSRQGRLRRSKRRQSCLTKQLKEEKPLTIDWQSILSDARADRF